VLYVSPAQQAGDKPKHRFTKFKTGPKPARRASGIWILPPPLQRSAHQNWQKNQDGGVLL
jgi:hypothetical protein